MSAPFSLPLRHSPLLWAALLATHLAPLVAVVLTAPAPAVSFPLVVAVGASAVFSLRRARRLHGCSLRVAPRGESVLSQGGATRPVEILAESREMGWLVVIAWREADGRVRRAALTRDAFPAETWRALRRFVRWEAGDQAS
ncbi:MAG: protein YgfX [Candidatus Dactylopiibacterium sp.]|nr:protein YgfX [Candidatus Dactylopiibacterium sp.]